MTDLVSCRDIIMNNFFSGDEDLDVLRGCFKSDDLCINHVSNIVLSHPHPSWVKGMGLDFVASGVPVFPVPCSLR